MSNYIKNIEAAAALGKIIEIKRYSLKEDYDYLLNNKSVQDINYNIKANIGLNIFEINNISEINRYEAYLQKIINKDIALLQSSSFVDQQLQLIDSIQECPLDTLKSFNKILISNITDFFPKEYKPITPTLIQALKNPYRVQMINVDPGYRHFLTASNFSLRKRDIKIVFHSVYSRNAENFDSTSMFLYDINSSRVASPVMMFLHALNKYGVNIRIGNVKGKFIFKTRISSLSLNPQQNISFDYPSKTATIYSSIRSDISGVDYHMAYGIDNSKLKRDLDLLLFL